jgi:hypothetical protein
MASKAISVTLSLEEVKAEAAALGYRLSKIPESSASAEDKPKRTRRGLYLMSAPPVLEIRDEVDKEDECFLTATEGQIKVLEKLFMKSDE